MTKETTGEASTTSSTSASPSESSGPRDVDAELYEAGVAWQEAIGHGETRNGPVIRRLIVALNRHAHERIARDNLAVEFDEARELWHKAIADAARKPSAYEFAFLAADVRFLRLRAAVLGEGTPRPPVNDPSKAIGVHEVDRKAPRDTRGAEGDCG